MDDVELFDTAMALYHWLQHNWRGQDDELYADFCKLTEELTVRGSEQYFENASSEVLGIYDSLTRENYHNYLAKVLNA